jgi:serine O-acetyltransferase
MSSRAPFLTCVREDLQRLSGPATSVRGIRLWARLLHPRYGPVLLVRLSSLCYPSLLLRPVAFLLSMLNMVLFGLEVTPRCRIGGGLFLPHTVGTVIGAREIGRNATIFQGVTLGAKSADLSFDASTRPVLGDNVLIGAGAKVLGGIHIGDGAIIAANSLVLSDVSDNARMMGVPAEDRRTGP